jgi:hypothetical protein
LTNVWRNGDTSSRNQTRWELTRPVKHSDPVTHIQKEKLHAYERRGSQYKSFDLWYMSAKAVRNVLLFHRLCVSQSSQGGRKRLAV